MAPTSEDDLLRAPSQQEYPTLTRLTAAYVPQRNYDLAKGEEKHYQQQFSDMYFLRLAKLKPAVEKLAEEAWEGYQIAGDEVHKVDRVLDVRQGELCWVAGTVYMDMPLKPNILDDISKDHWIAAPPPREKYLNPNGQDKIMLEDESGRLRLIGVALETELLVTGCIIAVMGTENADGDFEVIDIKVPDLPSHPIAADLAPKPAESDSTTPKDKAKGKGKVAIVSGLGITGDSGSTLSLDLLMEFFLGESTSPSLQALSSQITRLIIAGNSIAEATPLHPDRSDSHHGPTPKSRGTTKKYGYDASAYNPAPTAHLDNFLATLLPSLPITLMPGASDPANVSIPQQPLHPALFPHSRVYAAPPNPSTAGTTPAAKKPNRTQNTHPLHPATNPSFFTLGSPFSSTNTLFLGHAGQPITDISKYVPLPSTVSSTLDLMEATLRWRLLAPTAPDTLWCYPFQTSEPFVLDEGWCPHVYFVGNMPGAGVRVVEGPRGERVRCVSVPGFKETGEVVVLDLDWEEGGGEGEGMQIVRFVVQGADGEGRRAENGEEEKPDFFAGV